jgi:hypothetical protein
MTNTLYYGDNLSILRDHIADESVDREFETEMERLKAA